MSYLDELHAVLREGPQVEAEHREMAERAKAAAEKLRAENPDDSRLGVILTQGEAIQKLIKRTDELELMLLRVGIESLERIEKLEQRQ